MIDSFPKCQRMQVGTPVKSPDGSVGIAVAFDSPDSPVPMVHVFYPPHTLILWDYDDLQIPK